MTCEESKQYFADLWQGALNPEVRGEFEAHLASCDACAREARELGVFWEALEKLPEPEPSVELRAGFYTGLREARQRRPEGQARWAWWRHPAFQAAAAAVILAAGIGIGIGLMGARRADPQISELKGEVENMRQLVTLSLLQQQSASDRLRGVTYSYRVEPSDVEVLSALLQTLNHDPNVNVRLAAVDALRNFSDSEVARHGLVQALAKQKSPLMQISILDQVVAIKERSAVPAVRALLEQPDLNPDTRQRAEWALEKLQ
ncbi:MAG: zf-HC2 domain-containing protein [Bryobacteraceae bacterium]